MPKTIIITVGTSVFDDKKNIILDNQLSNIAKRDKNKDQMKEDKCNQWRKRLLGDIEYCKDDIEEATKKILNKWNSEELKELPAELSSLKRFNELIKNEKRIELSKEEDRIYLLCSESHKGILSAIILEKFLKENVVTKTERIIIEGLKEFDEESFKDIGLRKLTDKVAELCDEDKGDVYIIATGGYKPESIYVSLTGMLHKKPIYYLHEEFQNIVELPVLPISLDFDLWRENAIRIELVIGRNVSEARNSFNSLNSLIKDLIIDDNGVYKWTAVGEMLYNTYKDTSEWSPLQARGKSLLSYLNNDNLKGCYERYLKELGDGIWIGDKVPEMVDHAIRHHQNLFEIAERFLVPLIEATGSNPFMTAEEIYVLLCVILLHDCGHSLPYFLSNPKRNLMPTEVRTWHNILGYERLNPKYSTQEESLAKLLTALWKNIDVQKVDDENMKKFWEEEMEAIATIGLYHRKRMPLKGESYTDGDVPISEQTFPSMESICLKFHGERFTDKAVKIAAIFRIIDNCDTQIARAGRENERKLRAEVIGYDINAEKQREKDIRKLLSDALKLIGNTNSIETNLQCEIEISRNLYSREERGEKIDDMEKKKIKEQIKCLRKSVDEEIGKISDETKRNIVNKAVKLVRETANRVDFKREQKAHFEKHAKVEKVSIIPDFTNGKYGFIIRIRGKKQHEQALKGVKKGMLEEYEAAKTVLNDNNIWICYDELDLYQEAEA